MSAEPVPTTPVDDAIAAMTDAWNAERRAERFDTTPDYKPERVYLSKIRECTRWMALDMTHPGDEPPFSDDALNRMARGTDREKSILRYLDTAAPRSRIPFEVTESQLRLEIKDRDGLVLASGRIDARIKFANGVEFVADVKLSRFEENIERWEDMDRSPWTRHWPDQVLMYAYQRGIDNAMVIFDRAGTPKFIPIPLLPNLDRIETDLQRMRAAVRYRHGLGPLPAATEDLSECRRCPHAGKSCANLLEAASNIRVLADDRLVRLAEIREANRDAATSYKAADEQLKDALRGVEMGLLGPFQVIGKWSPNTTYDVPKEIKDQYRRIDPRGRFTLQINRVMP